MKEMLIYSISGTASLFILGYSVHIMVGGMVSERTEIAVIAGVVLSGMGVMAWMVRDVVRRRGTQCND